MEDQYVVHMVGDLEPWLHGPYSTDEAAEEKAKALRKDHSFDGIYRLSVNWDKRELGIDCFGFLGEDDETEGEGE